MNVILKRQKIQAADNDVPIILVVEDRHDNLVLISHILIYLNYNFVTVSKGIDALELATRYEIDLVLLDLVLPDISGFEVIERLRKHILTKNMPIVAISALATEKDRDRAIKAGCNDYLTKPYLIDDLKHKIQQQLPKSFLKQTLTQIMKFSRHFYDKPLILNTF